MARRKQTSTMLRIGDVARLLNVHVNTVRRWNNDGILKAYRIGHRGDRRFRREDIAAFLKGASQGSQGNSSKPQTQY